MSTVCIITACLITLFTSTAIRQCNKLKVGEDWYESEQLWTFIGRPSNLAVHKFTNTLFFSYALPDTYSDVDFQLALINIDSKESQIIAGIKGGCAVGIDESRDVVYLGGTDGIFTYNMMTKIADFYKEKGRNIWSLYFKRNLFYISYPDQKLHIEVDGNFSKVIEFEGFQVDHFYIRPNNEIYFANKSGFYYFNIDNMHIALINEMITVRQISEDIDGKMYLTTNIGVFTEGTSDKLEKVLNMKNVYGLTFDRDNNIIFSDEMSINKLFRSDAVCYDSPQQ